MVTGWDRTNWEKVVNVGRGQGSVTPFYRYSVTVVPIVPPLPSSAQPTSLLPQSIPSPLSMFMGHSYMFFD